MVGCGWAIVNSSTMAFVKWKSANLIYVALSWQVNWQGNVECIVISEMNMTFLGAAHFVMTGKTSRITDPFMRRMHPPMVDFHDK